MNFLGLIRFKPCRASWLLGILHVLVKRMPDKAFWTLRYQGAADELKPCLSGTDIVLVLILMEATLGQRSLRRAWGFEDAESRRGRKCPFAFLRRKTLPVSARLSHSVVSNSLRPHGLKPARLLSPWGFSRQEYWSWLP